MESLAMFIIALFPLFFPLLFLLSRNTSLLRPWNWPLIKLLPTAYLESHRLYDKLTRVLAENKGTILLRTSLFTRVDILVTSDPSNVHHVLNSKFSIYPRGPEFQQSFDFLGDAIYIKEIDEWKEAKKLIHGFYKEPQFQSLIPKIIRETIENALDPVLRDLSRQGRVVDLQDLFNRFMLDTTCLFAMGFDMCSVRPGLPKCPLSDAMDDMGEAVFWRYILPEKVWRLQRWLGVGKEKKMKEACRVWGQTLDDFINSSLSNREEGFNVLKYYHKNGSSKQVNGDFLKANLMVLLFAGRDTSSAVLPWFFHLLSENLHVKSKILEEIERIAPRNKHLFYDFDQLSKMVYLHCAFCESLRLFPPVPMVIRDATQADVLPSGQKINPKTKIMLCSYAMARMPEIWGKDCEEFKPERWMTEHGEVKHMSSNYFLAFGSGPWACLGKEIGFARLKAIAATMLHNFEVDIVEGQSISPSVSALLTIKGGLKAEISSKWMMP